MSSFFGGAFGGGEIDLSSVGIELPTSIGTGRQSVRPGYMKDPSGLRVLDSGGNLIYLETPNFMTDPDGFFVLDAAGKKILNAGSMPYSLGSKTPLSEISVPCTWVCIQAQSSNFRDVFAAGPTVNYWTDGNRLSALAANAILFSIDDLSKVFIHGYVTDEVIFTYGMTEDQYLGDTDGFAITDTDDVPIG